VLRYAPFHQNADYVVALVEGPEKGQVQGTLVPCWLRRTAG